MDELESAIVEWVSKFQGRGPGFIENEFQVKGYPSKDVNQALQAMLTNGVLYETDGHIYFRWPKEEEMDNDGFGSQLLNHISDDNKNLAVPDYIKDVMDKFKLSPVKDTAVDQNPAVHSPSHYTRGGIEVIDFIEAKGLNFHLGNVVKYVSRAGFKQDAKIQDLEKALWYLNREITRIKTQEP